MLFTPWRSGWVAVVLSLLVSHAQAQLNFNPPRIVVADRAMELMLIDGPPARVAIPATGLEFVVNTDRDVFYSRKNDTWYLLRDGFWLKNSMLASGDWINTADLPSDFLTLQVSSDWPQVAAAMPARQAVSPPLPFTISYEPTELVLIDGVMKLEPVTDGGLQFVANTDSDLFRYQDRYYLLLSGRWFSTRDFKRQWSTVRNLPGEFARIPPGHRKARVMASVPGTPQAERAVAEAAKPKRAVVALGDGSKLEVPYVGEPSFVGIEATTLLRAENTPFQVIRHNNYYYLCFEGAWYSSTDPRSGWRAASEIPEAIYTIPPTDPAYNVTFVRVESFDDSSGQAAYTSTSGYYSRYYTGSTMVYGTGWYYPGYYNRSVYWRYPQTYGYRYGAPWGIYYPYGYSHSETYDIETREKDWEWDLNGNKRRVYHYGPRNHIGSGEYRMPASENYKGDGK
ncbi:MAG: hypothetical protein HKN57_07610 [Xanthomonadales bacterium]|nr:hypothetical protein [Gammaproteobacteria bacterium]MBT8052524.1 hypothetical protein [Gammaproteobacteria bacterium]NND57102.1 hypothetical protein [Xanthomonadales bacterium]NNK52752.1 hypothetical protein [Xanthomonadales bacterium]